MVSLLSYLARYQKYRPKCRTKELRVRTESTVWTLVIRIKVKSLGSDRWHFIRHMQSRSDALTEWGTSLPTLHVLCKEVFVNLMTLITRHQRKSLNSVQFLSYINCTTRYHLYFCDTPYVILRRRLLIYFAR